VEESCCEKEVHRSFHQAQSQHNKFALVAEQGGFVSKSRISPPLRIALQQQRQLVTKEKVN